MALTDDSQTRIISLSCARVVVWTIIIFTPYIYGVILIIQYGMSMTFLILVKVVFEIFIAEKKAN